MAVAPPIAPRQLTRLRGLRQWTRRSGEPFDSAVSYARLRDQNDCTHDTQTGSGLLVTSCGPSNKTCSNPQGSMLPHGLPAVNDSDLPGAARASSTRPRARPATLPRRAHGGHARAVWEVKLHGFARARMLAAPPPARFSGAADWCCPRAATVLTPRRRRLSAICGNGIRERRECDPLSTCRRGTHQMCTRAHPCQRGHLSGGLPERGHSDECANDDDAVRLDAIR